MPYKTIFENHLVTHLSLGGNSQRHYPLINTNTFDLILESRMQTSIFYWIVLVFNGINDGSLLHDTPSHFSHFQTELRHEMFEFIYHYFNYHEIDCNYFYQAKRNKPPDSVHAWTTCSVTSSRNIPAGWSFLLMKIWDVCFLTCCSQLLELPSTWTGSDQMETG